jgi:hypothetical protein
MGKGWVRKFTSLSGKGGQWNQVTELRNAIASTRRVALVLVLVGSVAAGAQTSPGQMTPREIVEFNARAHAEAGHKWCGTEAVTASLKLDLFRQAAKVRGRDAAWFERAARSSVLRLSHPLILSETKFGMLERCTAGVTLKLARGFAFRGGQRTLSADIGYETDFGHARTINGELDFTKYTKVPGLVVTATDADAIVTRLATLAPAKKRAPKPTRRGGVPLPK